MGTILLLFSYLFKAQGHRATKTMPIFEIFKQTISALWATKLRSFLTMFGERYLNPSCYGVCGAGFCKQSRRAA